LSLGNFYLWVKQRGGGCDYMIGCGEKTFPLKATTIEAARAEALSILDDHSSEDFEVEHAIIYTFTENVTFLYEKNRKERQQENLEAAKKAEIEKLESKLRALKGT
jgi:hypothetical protein